MSTQSAQMILDTHKFRELLREAYELSRIAQNPKYNLQSEETLREYEFWAPYVINDEKTRKNIGYKLHLIEMMSILLVIKDEAHNRDRYQVSADEIKEMYKVNPPRMIIKELETEMQNEQGENSVHRLQENVINFADYKMKRK